MTTLSIVTPTGARPQAFALCERWVDAQTRQPYEWIIVDDGPTPLIVSQHDRIELIDHVRPRAKWTPGANTQRTNMLEALDRVTGDVIAVIEDDDYYSPNYLAVMVSALEATGKGAIGEANARYYHVPSRSYREMGNYTHASLCQTVFRREFLGIMRGAVESGELFFDLQFWRRCNELRAPVGLIPTPRAPLAVGIKGLPGRMGIGVGHRPVAGWQRDDDLEVLKLWTGRDYRAYVSFMGQQEDICGAS